MPGQSWDPLNQFLSRSLPRINAKAAMHLADVYGRDEGPLYRSDKIRSSHCHLRNDWPDDRTVTRVNFSNIAENHILFAPRSLRRAKSPARVNPFCGTRGVPLRFTAWPSAWGLMLSKDCAWTCSWFGLDWVRDDHSPCHSFRQCQMFSWNHKKTGDKLLKIEFHWSIML
jgi:hypothetical protein